MLNRREFIQGVTAAAGAAATTAAWPGLATAAPDPIDNVILIRFGGGTRYTEWVGDPEHRYVPRLWNELRPQGTLFTNATNEGRTGHFPGAMYLATGRFDWYELDGKQRPETATLFEQLRKANGWADHEVILANHHQETNLIAYGSDAEYGSKYGALQLHPLDLREKKIAQMLDEDAELSEDMRRKLTKQLEQTQKRTDRQLSGLDGIDMDDPQQASFVRSIDGERMRHLDGQDAVVGALAIKAMQTLQPRFMMVVLQQVDVAHRGYWSLYTRAIANTDKLTYDIVKASQTLPFYKGRTAVVIVPDCGRSLDGKGNYGFQNHHAPDFGCRQIAMLAIGPGIRRGAVVDAAVTQADVAPTIGEMLRTPIRGTEGRVLHELWA